MDESISTIGDLLSFYFTERDIAAGKKRLEAGLDQLQRGFNRVLVFACEAAERLENMPPTPGYEPFLVEHGQHRLVARLMSHFLVSRSTEAANDARTERTVVDALRFLEKPGRTARAISRRATALLEAEKTGSPLGEVLHGSNLSAFEFLELLGAVVRGDRSSSQRVREIAAVLAPRLSVRRGRKASAATIAHELLLSLGSRSYSWDYATGDYSDPETQATRLAFGDPDFDPRPASRRQKKRLRPKSN